MGRRPPVVPAKVRDAAIALGVAGMLLAVGVSTEDGGTVPNLLGYALLAGGGLALYPRRRRPVPVLAATGACAVGYQAMGFDVPAVAFLFAVYAAVREGHRLAAVVAAVAVLLALPLAGMVSPHDWPIREALSQARGVLELGWLATAGAAGEALRQAERRADEAERTREEAALRRADEERLHIARELHDSLTHQISIIKVQAEVAVHLARRRGEDVPEAVLAIQEAGREANRELRATLAALRDDGRTAPRGIADVPELVRRSGVPAELTVDGETYAVPSTVDRTAYRIVQESLTNVARHARAATASVRVGYRPDGLTIAVEDDGAATAETVGPPGVGLLGMRERVSALGGAMDAGPRDGGGFAVRVELPVERAA